MNSRTFATCAFAPLLLLALPQAHAARTIRVPGQQPTIQAAINASAVGDTVLVSPGTYYENIDFKGKAITLLAVHAAKPVIIDGQQKGPVVTFKSQEKPTSVLDGFTIQNGWTYEAPNCFIDGGGICIMHSSPTIRHNRIIDNFAPEGGGIAVQFGAPLIEDNYIGNNHGSGGDGGGIYLYATGALRITGNVIENNQNDWGGGIAMFGAGPPTITGNTFRGNSAGYGGGVWLVNGTDAYIGQNLFADNQAYYGAAIYYTVPEGDRGPFIVNNTIADNTGVGQAFYADGFDVFTRLINNLIIASPGQTALFCGSYDNNPPIMHDNDVVADPGLAYVGNCTDQTHHAGNISADPLFVSAATGDYHLQALSPAIDTGTNTAPRLAATDFDGNARIIDGNLDGTATVDMGIYEYKPAGAASATAASIAPLPCQVTRTGMAAAALRRFESVDRNHQRTVQYYDAAGRLVAEVDAHGVYHREQVPPTR